VVYYNLGQLTNAEKYLLGFLKLTPDHSGGLNHRASVQARLNRLDDAEPTLGNALSLAPDTTTVHENHD
jgi:predicted Zn-dependent protease